MAVGYSLGLAASVLYFGALGDRYGRKLMPVRRAGMASGTADLQRDLGGAIMQSILGALLTAAAARGYDAGARKGAPYRGICTHAG